MVLQIDLTSYPSPNYSERPAGVEPDMIVLHTGEGTKESDLATLRSTRPPVKKRVSSNYYVDRAGNVYQLVAPERAAWHAGASSWKGRGSAAIRDCSIGIETEHKRGQNWPATQRDALRQLCLLLIERYQIPQRFIVAHRWIATPFGRKSDPSDWPDADLHTWIAALYPPPLPPAPPTPAPAIDPLRAKQIAGIDRVYFCGIGFAEYYQSHEGMRSLGYPLGDEFETVDTAGERCTLMPFERGALKYKASEQPWAVRPALLSELQKLGLV